MFDEWSNKSVFWAGELEEYMNIFRIICLLLVLSVPAQAQQQDIQTVISNQINAFLKDDISAAYTYAAPNIKQMFPTPEVFGMMVRQGYPMVYKPSAYRFSEAGIVAGTRYQNVLLEDQSGRFYIAEYAMVETKNGWKIKAVRVYPRPGAGV
jgi:uncharacterized protein DUF4864